MEEMEKTMDEIIACSRYFEGEPPEGWELVAIRDNRACRIRHYRDQEGNYWHTAQRKKKGSHARTVTWEDGHGRTFAARVYPKRKKREGIMKMKG